MGSTARTNVDPSLDASQDEPPSGDEGIAKRILVPTDFSSSSWLALAEAVRIARRNRATITLLHVVDVGFHPPPTGPLDINKLWAELWQEALSKLGQAVLGLAGAGVEVQALIRQGLPWEEIVDTAQRYDLLVIARHNPRPFWRLFSRNTVKGVLEAAPCPVMVLSEKSAAFSESRKEDLLSSEPGSSEGKSNPILAGAL